MNKTQSGIDEILSDNFWPPKLEINKHYVTIHDDINSDSENPDAIHVSIDRFGDCYVSTTGRPLRFRTFGGGGKFLRVRNALVLLAEAIRQEGERPLNLRHMAAGNTHLEDKKYSSAIVEIIHIMESRKDSDSTVEAIKKVLKQFK